MASHQIVDALHTASSQLMLFKDYKRFCFILTRYKFSQWSMSVVLVTLFNLDRKSLKYS